MGVSLLYHLCKLGWQDVVLLEKSDLTHGSTWHAAGLCTHFAHNATIMEMRATSVRLYRDELEKESGLPTGFHGTGALRVTRSEDRMAEFRHVRGLGKIMGYDFHIITPDELKDLHPLADTGDGLVGGIFEPDDGHVDPSQATLAMATCARQMGARIRRNARVTGLDQAGNGEWRVETSIGEFVAEHVVNAAGTWCREIGEMMGIDLPVVPILHQYLVTDDVPEVAELEQELPIIRDPEESWYVRRERNGLICGPYEKSGQPWSVDGIPKEFGADLLPPDLDSVFPIVEKAMRRVPVLESAGVKTVINGPITFTPDANPLIGPAFGLDRAWLLTGSSMGVMEGGGAGKFLAEWMVNGEPTMDPIAIDSRRFGAYANRDYRVKKAVECFGLQFGIHYPREERLAARPAIVSPLYKTLKSVGAVYGSVYGYERPNWFEIRGSGSETVDSFKRTNWFEPVASECANVARGAGIVDLSVLSKFEITGTDAEKFMNGLGANKPPTKIGGISLIHVLNKSGGVESEFTVVRLSEDRYYATSAAVAQRRDLDLLRTRSSGLSVNVKSVTYEYGVIGIMGPDSRHVMEELTKSEISNEFFPWLQAKFISINKVSVLALRVSYVGELGWELHIPLDDVKSIHEKIIEIGSTWSVAHFGAFAMESMRLEKGYRAWGADLTTERTPLEAGLGYLVKTEGRDFIGRDAMLRRQESKRHWKMVLLEIATAGIDSFYAHPVLLGDRVVGMVTSGGYGHRTGKSLALAYLYDREYCKSEELEVEITGHRFPAVVLSKPPYDPSGQRLKS